MASFMLGVDMPIHREQMKDAVFIRVQYLTSVSEILSFDAACG